MPEMEDQQSARTRAGILDVAALAGVSPATVSRSMSGRGKVAEQTRKRVLEAARTLSYEPSPYAASLASGRTRTVAVVVPFATRWYFATVVSGVTEVLADNGYDVLLYHLGSASARDRFFGRMPLAGRIDGILNLAMPLTEEHTLALRALDIPLVAVGSLLRGRCSVRIDEVAVATDAVNHLLHLGHERIAFIGGAADDPGFGFISSAERLLGYRQALTSAGLEPDPQLEAYGPYGIDGGAIAMTRLLSQARRPTAVFAEYDELAFGALWALRKAGLNVPQDVSIVGVDGHEMAGVMGLTTIAQDVAHQGGLGAQMLLAQMTESPTAQPTDQVLGTRLVLRGSTAPPRATVPGSGLEA